ncbi:amidohydrolase [Enterocloster lavalensis]|uniref:amidohydrolase n=1 Tax=Enterocloster lavalensis TaxID=460384 RepID=UPI002FD9BCF7
MDAEFICSEIERNREEIIKLSLALWENPEGPYEEFKASAWTADLLEKHGFEVEREAGGIKTAVKACFGTGRPVIGFLGEYDALPGLSQTRSSAPEPVPGQKYGHGCGHNLICGANVGAVIALKAQMERDHIPGTIVFYGCPAEEVLTGKPFMARVGLFDGLDAALAFHPMESNMTTCGNMTAADMAKFHFKGISAHASADPYNGRSALDAVELMDIGANYLREHIKPDARIHYAITEGGTVPNIVPDRACVWYFVRAAKREDVEAVYERLVDVARGAALMTGTKLEVEYLGGCYDTLNNSVLEEVVHQAMLEIQQEPWTGEEIAYASELNRFNEANRAAVLGRYDLPDNMEIHEGVLPMLTYGDCSSSDIGDVAHIVPTAFFTTACSNIGAPGHSWQVTACSANSIGWKGMLYGAKILAKSALELLTVTELLEKAGQEFRKATKGKPYRCPLPEGMRAPGNCD